MTPQRITMITLAVADIERSRKFYSALGWTEAEVGNDTIAFFKMSGQYFALYSKDALAKDLGQPIPESTTGATTLAINFTSQDDVDTAFAEAIGVGAVAITQPVEVFWGGYSGNYTDPDGHLWEVAYNPFWQLGAEGQLKL